VLTRPRAQVESLAGELRARGATVTVFPALEIVPVPLASDSQAALATLAFASLAVFVSANAVTHGLGAVRRTGIWPSRVPVAAIGEATADALRNSGFDRVISPMGRADSETLLACPELQAVSGQNIIIFRGVGGREQLRATLVSRGASVSYVECYRRMKPPTDPAPLRAAIGRREVDAVHVMSAESLDNFLDLAGLDLSWSDVTLVVPHEAIARHPAATRFGRTVVAGPGADALSAALLGAKGSA
jgi:uroporphyrinogen-III synthase